MTKFLGYETDGFYDETFEADGQPRAGAALLMRLIASLPAGELLRRQRAAEQALLHLGITFNVYGDVAGTERIFPFDIVPRIVDAADWAYLERGVKQRIEALNLFIDDVYHDRKIIKDGIVPEYVIESAASLLAPCAGLNPPRRVWCHITGTDLVRDRDGQLYVLEDNLGLRPASRTCSRTGKSSSARSLKCSRPPACGRWTTIRAVSWKPSSISPRKASLRPPWSC